jgi:hypothetical protein
MATIKKTPGAQTVLAADFTFGYTTGGSDGVASDSMLNTASPQVLTAFSAATGTTFDVLNLPFGAQVVAGDLNVITAVTITATATVAIGDSASASRYLGATTLKTAGRTALVPTGYISLGEPLRLTVANADATGAVGKAKVTVLFTIAGRIAENLKTT